MQKDGKGLSIAALVLGIISIILAWFYGVGVVGIVCGVVGIILAVLGKKQAKAIGAPTGIGTAGLVVSIIGTALAVIGFITCTLCVCCAGGILESI